MKIQKEKPEEKPEPEEKPVPEENPETEEERVRAYNREYYLRRKEELAKKKQERYLNDESYRDGLKERSHARWYAKPKKDFAARTKDFDDIPLERRNVRIVYYEGKRVRFYCLSAFAKMLGITAVTLNNWSAAEVLTKPKYIENGRKKWYSEFYVNNVKEVFLARQFRDMKTLKALIEEKFRECPDIDFTGLTSMTDDERETIINLPDID